MTAGRSESLQQCDQQQRKEHSCNLVGSGSNVGSCVPGTVRVQKGKVQAVAVARYLREEPTAATEFTIKQKALGYKGDKILLWSFIYNQVINLAIFLAPPPPPRRAGRRCCSFSPYCFAERFFFLFFLPPFPVFFSFSFASSSTSSFSSFSFSFLLFFSQLYLCSWIYMVRTRCLLASKK